MGTLMAIAKTADLADMAADSRRTRLYDDHVVKAILAPINIGLGAARHLAWYVSYQVTGEARDQ
jgi:hypothetical protein